MHNFLEKQLPGCVAWGLGRPRGRAATPSHLPPDQAATPSSPDVSSSHGAPSRSAASATSHRWPWHPTASCIFGARFLCILFFHFLCLLSHQCKQALAAIQTRRWPLSFLQLRQVRSQQEHLGCPTEQHVRSVCFIFFLTVLISGFMQICWKISILGQPKLPKNFEEDTWAILKDAITAIFLKQKLSCDVEKLYQVTLLLLTRTVIFMPPH